MISVFLFTEQQTFKLCARARGRTWDLPSEKRMPGASQDLLRDFVLINGLSARARGRTWDLPSISRLLYQLSYARTKPTNYFKKQNLQKVYRSCKESVDAKNIFLEKNLSALPRLVSLRPCAASYIAAHSTS